MLDFSTVLTIAQRDPEQLLALYEDSGHSVPEYLEDVIHVMAMSSDRQVICDWVGTVLEMLDYKEIPRGRIQVPAPLWQKYHKQFRYRKVSTRFDEVLDRSPSASDVKWANDRLPSGHPTVPTDQVLQLFHQLIANWKLALQKGSLQQRVTANLELKTDASLRVPDVIPFMGLSHNKKWSKFFTLDLRIVRTSRTTSELQAELEITTPLFGELFFLWFEEAHTCILGETQSAELPESLIERFNDQVEKIEARHRSTLKLPFVELHLNPVDPDKIGPVTFILELELNMEVQVGKYDEARARQEILLQLNTELRSTFDTYQLENLDLQLGSIKPVRVTLTFDLSAEDLRYSQHLLRRIRGAFERWSE